MGMGVMQIRDLIVGEQGSTVKIVLRDGQKNEIFEAELMRGSNEFLDDSSSTKNQNAPVNSANNKTRPVLYGSGLLLLNTSAMYV